MDFRDWKQWGAFCIPAVGVIVVTVLLLTASTANIEQATFIQKVVLWTLGSAVIAFGHSIWHSTKKNLEKTADLSFGQQAFWLTFQGAWFVLFLIFAGWLW